MLRVELQGALGRRLLPSQEQFYSAGPPQAALAWHTDEAHAEVQGSVAFNYLNTRRSISWLLYLNEDGWDEPDGSGSGGAFRGLTRSDAVGSCGAHEGNLQVGWLYRGGGSEPVFLDSWVVPFWMHNQTVSDVRAELQDMYDDEEEMQTSLLGYQPAYVLYCVGVDGRREDLSQPHEANSEDHLPWGDGSWLDKVPSLRQMLPAQPASWLQRCRYS